MKNWGLVGFFICILVNSVMDVYGQIKPLELNFGPMIPSSSFFGKESIERIGYALAGGGDVNGDGFDDFLIGTFHNATMGHDAGAAYLFLGHSHLRWGLDDSVASADARFLGKQAYDAAGYSIACNGDLNGDGIDDIIIGAPAGNDKVPWMSGRVYIIFGKKEPDWGFYFHIDDSCDAIYEGEDQQDLAGLSVVYVGDVNGDGYDDFLVGAPFKDGKYVDQGKAYLILGRSEPWLKNDNFTYAVASFKYEQEGAETGYSVAGVGDVNDDGIPDFAIGAFGSSNVFVLYGRTDVSWGTNFDMENADLILYGTHRYTNEGVGWKVAGDGDLNGDGISDIIISAIHDCELEYQAGKVYVLFGKSEGWDTQEVALKNGDASFLGEQAIDQAGWGLAMAGDVDGDGYDDFLVGTYKDYYGPVDGKAYLIKGKPTGWQMNVPLTTIPDYCERDSNGIGYAASTAGDFDNDGLDDYVISAPFNSYIQQWNGKVFLFASQQLPYKISGNVTYYQSAKPIPEAIIQADTIATANDTSDILGQYQLLVKGKHDYTVHIQKAKDENSGTSITSYDAALIASLVINLNTPDSINIEAADVNLDNRINIYDAANVLRYSVKLPPLPDSYAGEWVFFPDSVHYDSITADQIDQNYYGFIRGDVDVSWQYPDSRLPKINYPITQIAGYSIRNDEEFYLPIAIKSKSKIISFDLDISYDPQELEFLRIEKTDLTENFQLAYNETVEGRLLIGAFSRKEINNEGTLIHIIFKVKETTESQTDIVVNKFQINNSQIYRMTVKLMCEDQIRLPEKFQLIQNYPNPFNNLTYIPFTVAKREHVRIVIYNTIGERIRILIDQTFSPGRYRISWDGRNEFGNQVASGVYIGQACHTTGIDKIKIICMK